jgi:hypothetical protein
VKKVPRSQRKTLVSPKRVTPKGNNGLKHRKEKRRAEADARVASPRASQEHSADSPRTYRPEELLSPHMLLARFTERATELLTAVPEEARPTQAAVAASLRQAVLEAFRSREEYVARMVEVDLLAGAPKQNATSLRKGIRAALLDQGVRCVDAPGGEHELFVVVEGDGEAFEVLRPAYVDQATGKLVLAGQLRRLPGPDGADDSAGGDDAANGEGK